MQDEDFENVRSRLLNIKQQFDSLIKEIENESPDRTLVKTKYGVLKVKLRTDRNYFDTKKGQAQASFAESAFYYPAITEAYLELKVKVDAPPNDKMLQCLISAEDYISHYLRQMNS